MAQLQRLVISASQKQASIVILKPEQQHYLYRVLRLKSGDRFIAMDGQGNSWLAELQPDHAALIEPIIFQSELPIAVTLMLALPKTGFDDVIRPLTELGVACVVPIISDRTLLNPSPNKLERWRRIAQEAAEQSERQCVPAILDPLSFSTALQTIDAKQRLICAARGASPHLLTCRLVAPSVCVAIGCEGGWTDAEIDRAIASQYQPVSLGRRILRAVTAPIAAMALLAGAQESREMT
ncbi:16S rRNA (uracil(1498)-N(3))-methyltransferase [Myxacorys almedinensis]|uniref:Ribosomal RNA small subunit methyltransferase E n=1 Tax=Myxacorys almedinensis A TaxID=2690445 RepID=A0A8J7Z0T5_9CYAN|nr:16S rRNA (uracil(1498)-N(3))-methyltransferase [Myxacorys almedinensis]NDJ17619.1 16S rRNA (uracil(1498)-N(3))-methyltransferase [Myxacorys almedinensis A]